jgi:hypothetical protein
MHVAKAVLKFGLSARAHDRILKIARTRADLEGREDIRDADVLLAIDCRMMDRKSYGGEKGAKDQLQQDLAWVRRAAKLT